MKQTTDDPQLMIVPLTILKVYNGAEVIHILTLTLTLYPIPYNGLGLFVFFLASNIHYITLIVM